MVALPKPSKAGIRQPPTSLAGGISFSSPSLLLKPPKEEQDENDYQDRSQNTARTIAPTLAMRPRREGPHEQNNDNNQHNQSHVHLLLPLARRAALI